MMTNMVHVVVGCGGSGAKSACGLARLMAQDPRWRHEMDESVFFLLVDTDAGDLLKYEKELANSVPGVHVSSIQTSRGFRAPHEILAHFEEAIAKSGNHQAKALERFAAHWWVKHPTAGNWTDAAPFKIHQLDDITIGAGQVPMISFLATWQALKDNRGATESVESIIDGLFEQIANKTGARPSRGGTPLDKLNIVFVGSVAGGTGRGCVIPIAFKMKERLQHRFGSVPRVSGYFLDQSCFAAGREVHEELPQMLNAMTGWSELSAWFGLYDKKQDGGYRYSLPGLVNMHDPKFDVLGAEGGSGHLSLTRPFDAVGLIGAANATGISASRDVIYDMLAVGLYVAITDSHVHSRVSNEGRRYFSIGTSIIEVPFEALRDYYVQRARFDAAQRVGAELSASEVERVVRSLLGELDLGPGAMQGFLSARKDREAQGPLQRLALELLDDKGEIAGACSRLEQAMQAQDLDLATEEVDAIDSEAGIDALARRVGQRFTELLGKHLAGMRDDGAELKSAEDVAGHVRDRLLGSKPGTGVFGQTGSARVVAQVVQRLAKALDDLAQADGELGDAKIQGWKANQGKALRDCFEQAKNREGLLGLGRKRFTDEEIVMVSEAARRDLLARHAKALARALVSPPASNGPGLGLVRVMQRVLEDLKARADAACSLMTGVLRDAGIGRTELERIRERLFADPERLESSIPDTASGSADYMLRRTIRPLEPEAVHLRLESLELEGAIRAQLKGLGGDPGSDGTGRALAQRTLGQALQTARYTWRGEAVTEAFHLAQVLRNVVDKWPAYLSRLAKGNRDRYKEVEQRFRNFFGIQPVERDGEVRISVGDHAERLLDVARDDFLMLGMATVAARTCRPFWRTRTDRGETPRLTVQVPLDPPREAEWRSEIQQGAGLGSVGDAVTLIRNHENNDRQGFNPYIMVVYSQSGASSLEDVTSLDAWRQPDIQRCLEAAETLSHADAMPFRQDMWPGYRGSGFTDPAYVFEQDLRRHRWRPWAKDKGSDAEDAAQTREMLVALAYAWLGPEWILRGAVNAKGRPNLSALLEEADRRKIRLLRQPVLLKDEGYDLDEPLRLVTSHQPGHADFPAKDSLIADSADALLERVQRGIFGALDPLGRVIEGMCREYQSFLDQVGYRHGLDPKHNPKGYSRLLDILRTEATRRVNEGSDVELWRAIGRALDVAHPDRTS